VENSQGSLGKDKRVITEVKLDTYYHWVGHEAWYGKVTDLDWRRRYQKRDPQQLKMLEIWWQFPYYYASHWPKSDFLEQMEEISEEFMVLKRLAGELEKRTLGPPYVKLSRKIG
jgi:hypothetical protein